MPTNFFQHLTGYRNIVREFLRRVCEAANRRGSPGRRAVDTEPASTPAGPDPDPRGSSSDEVEVLAALLASDQGGNEATLQATTNIIAIVLAYLAVALFVVSDSTKQLPLGVLLAIPAPIFLLQTLQMTWAAGVVARAGSAERIEKALAEKAGETIKQLYTQDMIGSKTTTRLTDIRRAGGSSAFVAQAPYVGFYLLSALFAGYVLYLSFIAAQGDPIERLFCVLASTAYGVYFAVFALAAVRSFGIASSKTATPPVLTIGKDGARWLAGLIILLAGLGISFQAIQVEDTAPMYEYFTIWSAATNVLGWLLLEFVANKPFVRAVAAAGSIGSLLSGAVYWLSIFPVNGVGTQWETIAANVTLHLFLPIAILVRLGLGPRNWKMPGWWSTSSILLPLAFLLAGLWIASATGAPSPYAFLRPKGSPFLFSTFCIVFLLVWLALSRIWSNSAKRHRRQCSAKPTETA